VGPGPAEGTWRVRIDRPSPPSTTNSDRDGWREEKALAGALRSGLIVDAANESIGRFAGEATAGASSPAEEALLLERAVYREIRIVDLRTAMATASQTLRDRTGDCTEHAVLLAACCRARGIPSRLVAGLIPIDGRMLFHLWTEVYLGEWIGLDATLGQGHAPICGLTLLRLEQPEDELTELNRSIADLVGRYRFEIAGSR
jgi:transglutaminase-like putative cysteine protease